MPRPSLRSKAQKRHNLKTPGHQNVVHYWRKKPSNVHCAICKKPIKTIPRKRPARMKKTGISSRRPSRLESGRYCAKCLQILIKEAVWNQ